MAKAKKRAKPLLRKVAVQVSPALDDYNRALRKLRDEMEEERQQITTLEMLAGILSIPMEELTIPEEWRPRITRKPTVTLIDEGGAFNRGLPIVGVAMEGGRPVIIVNMNG